MFSNPTEFAKSQNTLILLGFGPTQSYLRMVARNVFLWARRGVYLEQARSEIKREEKKNDFFLRKHVDVRHLFERPVVGRDTLSPLAPALGPQQKNWECHPLPLFMAISMVQVCDMQ